MKKLTEFVSILAALVMAFAFTGCPNNSSSDDPLSGNTYRLTGMGNGAPTITMSGTTITAIQGGQTIVITRSGSTYSATFDGEDVTESIGQSTLAEMYEDLSETYEEMSAMFEMTLTFDDGRITAYVPGEGTTTGTYSVDGNSGTFTLDDEPGTATTSDGWRTFVVNGSTVFTRQ